MERQWDGAVWWRDIVGATVSWWCGVGGVVVWRGVHFWCGKVWNGVVA